MPDNSEPLPDFFQKTANDTAYQLIMWASNTDEAESANITRMEYVAMKVLLAQLRGYVLTPEQKEKLD